MTTKWLALRSLRRNQQLLKAINTLSMHLQLIVEGHESDIQPATVETAQTELSAFIDRLVDGIQKAAESEIGVIYGADPRFQAFVEGYLDARQNTSNSPLAHDLLSIRRILDSNDLDDQVRLLSYLTSLRLLVEEQINYDAAHAL